LPIEALHTPYVFPTDNGLRCDTRNAGDLVVEGRFHFSVSRYSQQQLAEARHQTDLVALGARTCASMASTWGWEATTPGARACGPSSGCCRVVISGTAVWASRTRRREMARLKGGFSRNYLIFNNITAM
jgi:hypothetical protein